MKKLKILNHNITRIYPISHLPLLKLSVVKQLSTLELLVMLPTENLQLSKLSQGLKQSDLGKKKSETLLSDLDMQMQKYINVQNAQHQIAINLFVVLSKIYQPALILIVPNL